MSVRIIYDGDKDSAKDYLPQAQNLLFKVRSFVESSGVETYSAALAFNDLVYGYAIKTRGMEVIYIFHADQPTREDDITSLPMPDFLSGVTRDGLIRTQKKIIDGEDEGDEKYLDHFKPNAVCWARLNTHATSSSSQAVPTGYSTNKRLAVLPWGGFWELSNSYGEGVNARSWSQYTQLVPSMYSGRMQKLVQVILGYGVVHEKPIKVSYGYQFARTHGVVKDSTGEDWLVEISMTNGVIAMPLPIYQHSEKMKDSKYEDLAAAAEEFGGLPTGEGFPSGTKLSKAIAEGSIIRLATTSDLSPFYNNLTMYSSAFGWAFNEDGSQAHNTGYYYHADNMQRGVHYALHITIGSAVKNRKKNQPISTGFAFLEFISEGRIYFPSKRRPPIFKKHEPIFRGLVSHDFLLAGPARSSGVCDTTLFVFFADGQLKRVSYYYNPGAKSVSENENDYTECMKVGSWTSTTTTGSRSIPMMFYTSDVDDRQVLPDTVSVTTTTRSDLGWSDPIVGDDPANPQRSSMWKTKLYRIKNRTVSTAGMSISSGIVIPKGVREGYVYAYVEGYSASTVSNSTSYDDSELHPVSYEGYRGFYERPRLGGCYTKDVRKVTRENISESECATDFDSWSAICSPMIVVPGRVVPQGTYSTVQNTKPPIARATFYTNTQMGNLPLPMTAAKFGEHWPWITPDPITGSYQQMTAAHSSALGALQAVYDTALNATNTERKAYGSLMGDFGSPDNHAYNFIGVP